MKTFSDRSLSSLWVKLENNGENVSIDFSDTTFILPSSLVGICSFIDYVCSLNNAKCHLKFSEIDEKYFKNITAIRRNSILNESELRLKSLELGIYDSPEIIRETLLRIDFYSFLYRVGFFNLWTTFIAEGKIIIEYLNLNNLVKFIFKYSGKKQQTTDGHISGEFKRWTSLRRIPYNKSESDESLLKGVVLEFLDRVPEKHSTSSLFTDNDFDEVFLKNLSDNVSDHANTNAYIIARSYSSEDLETIQNPDFFLYGHSKNVIKNCETCGFFEICISDCGPGIFETLELSYKDFINKYSSQQGTKLSGTDENVLGFALDEFGSKHVVSADGFDKIVDKHSLNEIFQYVRIYGGSLTLISKNSRISYDTSIDIRRGANNIGFLGKADTKSIFHNGLIMDIILLHNPKVVKNYPKKERTWSVTVPDIKCIPSYKFVGVELGIKPNEISIRDYAAKITNWVAERGVDKLVLDFAGCDNWDPIFLYQFILSIQNILTKILCWGINFPVNSFERLFKILEGRNRLKSFPCMVDNDSKYVYLIGSNHEYISSSFSFLFSTEYDENGELLSYDFSIDEILFELRLKKKYNYNEKDIKRFLVQNCHLFGQNNKGRWFAKIGISEIIDTRSLSLKNNFLDLLSKTESIFSGHDITDGRLKLFKLPSSGKIVEQYLWTYRLLQRGHHTDEISTRIKALIDRKLDISNDTVENKFSAILSVTGTSRILAESIAKLYNYSPTVLDLGTSNNLDPDDVLISFDENVTRNCIIAVDVIDTKNLINKILYRCSKIKINIIAIVAIIKFVESGVAEWVEHVQNESFSIETEEEDHKIQKTIPVAVLYNYPMPKKFTERFDNEKHKMYWIEPYSLRPFLEKVLLEPRYSWDDEEDEENYPERICMFDKYRCILKGHFKDRNHHNRILIHMRRALLNETIVESILKDLIDFLHNKGPVSCCIIPLHSNISLLIPKLKICLRALGANVPIICTIPVDLKGRGPYYNVPEEVLDILKLSVEKSILFLDDGILTGRTVETFLRSTIRYFSGKKNQAMISLNRVLVYCIVNRVGRASSTKWRSIVTITDQKIEFAFKDYIRFECPVYSKNDCPICKDLSRMDEYLYDLTKERIKEWAIVQKNILAPIILNTAKYLKYTPIDLSINHNESLSSAYLEIDQPRKYDDKDSIRLSTIDGVIWWYWEKGYRGTPIKNQLNDLYQWVVSSNLPSDKQSYLLSEALCWAADNIDELRTKSTWIPVKKPYEPIDELFFEVLTTFLESGSILVVQVIEKIFNNLTLSSIDIKFLDELIKIMKISFKCLCKQTTSDRINNLVLSIYFAILRAKKAKLLFRFFIELKREIESTYLKMEGFRGYFINILDFLAEEPTKYDYWYCLNFLCKERYKVKHSQIGANAERDFYDECVPIERFGFLIDFLPKIELSLDHVFSAEKSKNTKLSSDIELIKDSIERTVSLLAREDNEKNSRKANIATYLKEIFEKLRGKPENTEIGRILDKHNPFVKGTIQTLLNDYNDIIARKIIIDETVNNKITVLCDDWVLLQCLKNNSVDVMEKHGNSANSKVKIVLTEDEDKIILTFHNSWIDKDKANSLVNEGDSLLMESSLLERHRGKIYSPSVSDIDGYISMIKIAFIKGYRR